MYVKQWICNGVEFKVGDKVRVVRQEEDGAIDGMGEQGYWRNNWVKDDGDGWLGMDGYLGLTFVIESITQEGVLFEADEDIGTYGFPLTSLEKVSA